MLFEAPLDFPYFTSPCTVPPTGSDPNHPHVHAQQPVSGKHLWRLHEDLAIVPAGAAAEQGVPEWEWRGMMARAGNGSLQVLPPPRGTPSQPISHPTHQPDSS